MSFRRILFPTDFSPCAEAALVHALYLAELQGAELHLLHAITETNDVPPHYFSDPQHILEEAEKAGTSGLSAILENHPDRTIRIVQKTQRGDTPEEVILTYAAASGCDLIIMGTHGRKGLQHFLLGSIAEAVARRANCPLLTVRSGVSEFKGYKKILAAVDFSEDMGGLIGKAKQLASVFGAKLTLVHVLEDFLYPSYLNPGVSEFANILPRIQQDRRTLLEQKARSIEPISLVAEHEILIGPCPSALLNYAESNQFDLILATTHTRSALSRFVLGSTAERIVRLAPCAVLTLKPELAL